LTKVKNYPFLVQLIASLPAHFKGIIVGDGEDRAMLTEIIQQQNLTDRFMLVGQKNNVEDYLSAMDIFAMPSFNEGLPFSVVEAQCAGLSCVASTGISMECNLTGNVTFADINSQEEWLQFCLNYTQIKRNDQCEKVKKCGYSIEEAFLTFLQTIGRMA
jgi:glycosyltransferase involved in cell wall biosynthesis